MADSAGAGGGGDAMRRLPCYHPGCHAEAVNGSYCALHGPPPDNRAPASQRGYDREWRAIRDTILADYPYCVECAAQGRETLATEVHHVRPIRQGGTHDLDNLIPLCHSCHMRTERGRGGKGG